MEEEFGIIPMTNADFPFFKNGMYYIGTAGGQTKASTGYTFRFIQKQADAIVEQLILTGILSKTNKSQKSDFSFTTALFCTSFPKICCLEKQFFPLSSGKIRQPKF